MSLENMDTVNADEVEANLKKTVECIVAGSITTNVRIFRKLDLSGSLYRSFLSIIESISHSAATKGYVAGFNEAARLADAGILNQIKLELKRQS